MGDDATRNVMDLVEPLEGEQGAIPYPRFPRTSYRAWRLRINIHQFLTLLDDSPEATGDRFMNFLLSDDELCRVVWVTDEHFIFCQGPEATNNSFDPAECPWLLYVQCGDSREYQLLVDGLPDADVLRAVNKAVALGSRITHATLTVDDDEPFPGVAYPGIEDYVSLAQSRRTVTMAFYVHGHTGRALAFRCNPLVNLDAAQGWNDSGTALAEAMLANQCPARLTLRSMFGRRASILAPALEATTQVEELTLYMQVFSCEKMFLDAVGRNQSIRVVVLRNAGPTQILCSDMMGFWITILTSATIQSVDVSGVVEDGSREFTRSERRACANTVAALVRFNSCLTSIRYDPRTHDAGIMESRVVPILHWNKLRPIFVGLLDVPSTGGAGRCRDRAASALLGSPLVCRHPQLLFFVLKSTRDVLLMPLASSSSSSSSGLSGCSSPTPNRKRGRSIMT